MARNSMVMSSSVSVGQLPVARLSDDRTIGLSDCLPKCLWIVAAIWRLQLTARRFNERSRPTFCNRYGHGYFSGRSRKKQRCPRG